MEYGVCDVCVIHTVYRQQTTAAAARRNRMFRKTKRVRKHTSLRCTVERPAFIIIFAFHLLFSRRACVNVLIEKSILARFFFAIEIITFPFRGPAEQ